MAEDNAQALSGPDLQVGVKFDELVENEPLLGHFDGEPVILVRQGEQIFATGAVCTHYSGPLAEGLVVGGTIRCPLHHARFDLRTGEADRSTGAESGVLLQCRASRRHGHGRRKESARLSRRLQAESLFRCHRGGRRRWCCVRGYAPCEGICRARNAGGRRGTRPGGSPESVKGFSGRYGRGRLDSATHPRILRIDQGGSDHRRSGGSHQPGHHEVSLRSGRTLSYGALLLATGAEPRSLPIEGADLPHVYRLRTLADSKAIIAKAQGARNCAVIGSGFIGLEVAASLRHRGLAVSVIGQGSVPLGKILGADLEDSFKTCTSGTGPFLHGRQATRDPCGSG